MSESETAHGASVAAEGSLHKTPLNTLHRELGAKLVSFAGYEMPLQYAAGIVKEHLHVREAAGLFDVSHMGQLFLFGPNHETTAAALEALVPAELRNLKPGALRYTQLLNAEGGIIDDLIVTRSAADAVDDGVLALVVNASRKDVVVAHLKERLPAGIELSHAKHRALLALQGPKAATVLERLEPQISTLKFMTQMFSGLPGRCRISRSGYTGEDGFEISVDETDAPALARRLLSEPEVMPIGLGARDTLRLEAGLGLYGQDMDEATSPVEAALTFSLGKRRRAEGGFPGFDRIKRELEAGPARLRVGLRLDGRAAARTGMTVASRDGGVIGRVTSGAFTPTASASIAMAYVAPALAETGAEVAVIVRGAPVVARVVSMPFVPHRYFRQSEK